MPRKRTYSNPYREYTVEWMDWDYKHHNTKYVPTKTVHFEWNDKRQIPSKARGSVRQILQRGRN